MAENRRIPELPFKQVLSGNMKLPIYSPIDDTTYHTDLSILVPAQESNDDVWSEVLEYNEGDIVSYQDEVWVSLQDNNLNNSPSVSPTFWTQGVKAKAGINDWESAIYSETNVFVLYNLDGYIELFKLVSGIRPYNSTNFENEYAAGDWEIISEKQYFIVTKTNHGFPVNSVLTIKSGAWNLFTTGDHKLAIVKKVIDINRVLVASVGARLKGFTGLTFGAIYYAQADGSISNVASGTPLMVAISISEAILLYTEPLIETGSGITISTTGGVSTANLGGALTTNVSITGAGDEFGGQYSIYLGDHNDRINEFVIASASLDVNAVTSLSFTKTNGGGLSLTSINFVDHVPGDYNPLLGESGGFKMLTRYPDDDPLAGYRISMLYLGSIIGEEEEERSLRIAHWTEDIPSLRSTLQVTGYVDGSKTTLFQITNGRFQIIKQLALNAIETSARVSISSGNGGAISVKYQNGGIPHSPILIQYQNRVATANNTTTTLHTIAVPSSTTIGIKGYIVARRTGGSAGTAEDGAMYKIEAVFNNIGGTATLIGGSVTVVGESQSGWDVVLTPSGATVLIQVTGATNNNITWALNDLRVMPLGSSTVASYV